MRPILVTTTFYGEPQGRDKTRFELAQNTVATSTNHSIPIIVVDGSPDSSVERAFSEHGALTFKECHRGIGPSRRQAFFHAFEEGSRLKCDVIVWIEAEKGMCIPHIPRIVAPVDGTECTVTIPARTKESWLSWPSFQRESEQGANAVYEEATGLRGYDPMFGPVAFHMSVAAEFITMRGADYGAADTYIQHFAPLVIWKHSGKKPVCVPLSVSYPQEQRSEEEGPRLDEMREKRREQLRSLSNSYRAIARKLGLT